MNLSIRRRVLKTRAPASTRTFLQLAIAATMAVAALALASPASATCYGDTCDADPVTAPEPAFNEVPVYVGPAGAVDMDWVSFDERGVPNGVGLAGWSTTTHVQVTWKGFFLMNVPSRETSSYMPMSGFRFTVHLPVYPLEGPVCVDAINYAGGPPVKRLGCISNFTWWL